MKTKELLERYAIGERIFAQVNLRGIDLAGQNLENTVLSQVDLTESNLQGANLRKADLTRAILINANLQRAKLASAQLNSAILCRANLTRANLQSANLGEADLTEAILVDANLQKTNLLGACLFRANLIGANLNDAKFLTRSLWEAYKINTMLLMKLTPPLSSIREAWIKLFLLSWWLEITTTNPYCIYWFGPFDSPLEARLYQSGYIEDLVEEQAEGITIKLQQCQPQVLTICSDSELD